jgi:predicted transcriptional regulator
MMAWYIALERRKRELRFLRDNAGLDGNDGSEQIAAMRAKELALDVIKHLPDDATMHELTEELYAAAVREGLDELDQGKGIPHDEVKRQFEGWFTK